MIFVIYSPIEFPVEIDLGAIETKTFFKFSFYIVFIFATNTKIVQNVIVMNPVFI